MKPGRRSLTLGTKLIILLLTMILVPVIGGMLLDIFATETPQVTDTGASDPGTSDSMSEDPWVGDSSGNDAQPTAPPSPQDASGELSSDLNLGLPVDMGHGNVAVTLTVTNTTGASSNYRMVVAAETPGSELTREQRTVSFEDVQPGESANVDVVFHPNGSAFEYEIRRPTRKAS